MYKSYVLINGVEYPVNRVKVERAKKPSQLYFYIIDSSGKVSLKSGEIPVDALHWNKEKKEYVNIDVLRKYPRLSGDTFKLNGVLKGLGFRFNWEEKVWVK